MRGETRTGSTPEDEADLRPRGGPRRDRVDGVIRVAGAHRENFEGAPGIDLLCQGKPWLAPARGRSQARPAPTRPRSRQARAWTDAGIFFGNESGHAYLPGRADDRRKARARAGLPGWRAGRPNCRNDARPRARRSTNQSDRRRGSRDKWSAAPSASRGPSEAISTSAPNASVEAFGADVLIASDPRLAEGRPTISSAAAAPARLICGSTRARASDHSRHSGAACSPTRQSSSSTRFPRSSARPGRYACPLGFPKKCQRPPTARSRRGRASLRSDPRLGRARAYPGREGLCLVHLRNSRDERTAARITPSTRSRRGPLARTQVPDVSGVDLGQFLPALRRQLNRHGFSMVEIAKARDEIFHASRLDPEHPWAQSTTASIADRTGRRVPAILPSTAGSLPNDVFSEALGLPTVWVPHSYRGCSKHAPNEHLPSRARPRSAGADGRHLLGPRRARHAGAGLASLKSRRFRAQGSAGGGGERRHEAVGQHLQARGMPKSRQAGSKFSRRVPPRRSPGGPRGMPASSSAANRLAPPRASPARWVGAAP